MIRRVAVLAAAVIFLGGCTGDKETPLGDKEAPLPVKTKAEVEQMVRADADAIAAVTGGTLDNYRTSTTSCDTTDGAFSNDGTWNLAGFAAALLPSDQHVAALSALRDRWQAEGWTITEDRTFSDGISGALSGRNPATGITVSVTSSNPPKQLGIIIGSPCYRPAPGEDPANG